MSDKETSNASTPENARTPSPAASATPSDQPPQAPTKKNEKTQPPSKASQSAAAANEKAPESYNPPLMKLPTATMPASNAAVGLEGEPAPQPGSHQFTFLPRDTGERKVAVVTSEDGELNLNIVENIDYENNDGIEYKEATPTFAGGCKISVPLRREFWIGDRESFKIHAKNLRGVGRDSLKFLVESSDKKKYWLRYSNQQEAMQNIATEMQMLRALSEDGGNRVFFPKVFFYHKFENHTFFGTENFRTSLLYRMQLVEVGMNLHCIRAVLKQLFEAVVAIRGMGIKNPNITPSSIRMRSSRINDLRVVVTNFNHAYDKSTNVIDNDTSRFTAYTPIDLVFRSRQYEKMEEWSLGVIAFHLMTGYSPFYTLEKDDSKKTLQMNAIVYGAHALLDNPSSHPFGDRMTKWYEIQKDNKGKERSMLKLKDSAKEDRDKFLANRRPIKPWAQRITFGPLEEAKQWVYMSTDATTDRKLLVELIQKLMVYRQKDRADVGELLSDDPFFHFNSDTHQLSDEYIAEAKDVLENDPDVIGDLWKALTMDATQGRSPSDPVPPEEQQEAEEEPAAPAEEQPQAPAEEQAAPAREQQDGQQNQ